MVGKDAWAVVVGTVADDKVIESSSLSDAGGWLR